MKKFFLAALTLAASLSAAAQENPLWIRYSAISPDAQTIAFSYKGDIYTVATAGGEARQLTTNAAYDSYPIWSPDGNSIAFASTREGSFDVYIISSKGGMPTRLTTHSANETPIAFIDNSHVLYSANIIPSVKSIQSPRNFSQVYQVATTGGRPTLFSTITMEDISINGKGDILYHDNKGYEDPFRKHHQSAITRDIWLCSKGKFSKLTTFRGEDRTPVWAADGESFYYLSEKDGTFNVWKRNLDGSNEKQLTSHTKNPVRFLTAANNGTLCYGYDGEIYTWSNGQETKVNISIVADNNDHDLVRRIETTGATEISLSPKGKEIAFVLHGDVYVTSLDYSSTKRITNTPEQERNINFSPDGKSIVYASEREGVWQIYQTSIVNKKEKLFTYATELKEERLTQSNHVSQYPHYSPDGKEIAFFENRADLRILNISTKQVRTVLDGKYNYSYSDGDLWFEWSPDSRWLLSSYLGVGGWHSPDIALVDASGKKAPYNLTNSGYSNDRGKWALGGKGMLFTSDRAGYRSHGSWGAEEDVYLMFFDLEAYERFLMNKEEKSLYDEAEKEKKKESADIKSKKDDKKKKKETPKNDSKKVLVFDLENSRDRIVRLTVNSSHLGDAVLSPRGDTLYYQAAFEDGYDLWKHDLLEDKTEKVLKDVGGGRMQTDSKFKTLYLISRGIKKVDLAKSKSENIAFSAPFDYHPYQERKYLFDHIWRQVKEKFYDTKLHGIDWEGYRQTYERFLPYINNNYDFRDMLSEMLGELNGSHTGARYRPTSTALKTAHLGVFVDQSYEGDGLLIEEVIKRGPFAIRNTGVTAGCIIEEIDGEPIKKGMDYNYMLDGKAGKRTHITVYNPNSKVHSDIIIKPISLSQLDNLLYKRWVDHNRDLVDSLSGGRLAYVHVRAMNSENFRNVYSELLNDKNRNRDAAIVDERGNGGGWLHDDLCTLLSGREYHRFMPNNKYVGRDPFNKWVKPSCVLMNEDCYSNGSGFPWVYRELGIGKLIGTPVAGTATSVWWETLMDRTMVFGIPQVGKWDKNNQFMENQELFPDIEVFNSPEDYITGHDRQLETAVKEMMKNIK